MMTDNEGRGLVLKRLYDLRENSVQLSQFDDLRLPRATVGRYLQQLKQLGFIEGPIHPSSRTGEVDQAYVKITVHGSEAVENPDKRPAQIMIDQSINVHGSQNVQVGNYNQQTVTIDVNKFNAAIEASNASIEEKAEAKSLLSRLSSNKLLLGLLGSLFSTTPTSSAG